MLVPDFNKNACPKELEEYTEEVITNHVSGRLKVAPEHTSDKVLKLMRKPSFSNFHDFKKLFDKINLKKKLNLQLIPYFISSHPQSDLEDMANMAAETKDMGFQLEQVQGFTPTPMTVATVIYYSGYHPYTLEKIDTPKTAKEKEEQHRFFFWYKKENQAWIRKSLTKIGRYDLLNKLLPNGGKTGYQKDFKAKDTFDDAVTMPKEIKSRKTKHRNTKKSASKPNDGEFKNIKAKNKKPSKTKASPQKFSNVDGGTNKRSKRRGR